MTMISAHDTVLYVQEAGRGEPLLFIHGACGDANTWDGLVGVLMGEFRCVAYDRRGHTRSPRGRFVQPSIELHAADAADLIQALGLTHAVVVGSDHGADVALALARRHPGLVTGAVLCGPPPRSIASASIGEYWMAVVSAVAAARTPRSAVEALFEALDAGSWVRMPGARREAARSNYPALQAALVMPPSVLAPSDLQKLTMTVQVITGSECAPCARQAISDMAGCMPHAQLVCIPGAGPLVYIDQPYAFSEAVRSFALQVAGVTGRSTG